MRCKFPNGIFHFHCCVTCRLRSVPEPAFSLSTPRPLLLPFRRLSFVGPSFISLVKHTHTHAWSNESSLFVASSFISHTLPCHLHVDVFLSFLSRTYPSAISFPIWISKLQLLHPRVVAVQIKEDLSLTRQWRGGCHRKRRADAMIVAHWREWRWLKCPRAHCKLHTYTHSHN